MQIFKKHIAIALLVGFLFPQIVGSMHFLVVPHYYSITKDTAVTTSYLFNQYHSCHFHLTGFPSFLASETDQPNLLFSFIPAAENFRNLEHYIQFPNYNFQLRGPPAV